jgi:hypothetical protein
MADAVAPSKAGEAYVASIAAAKPSGESTKAIFDNNGNLQSVDGKPVTQNADGSYGDKSTPGAPSTKSSGTADEKAPGGKKSKYLGNHVITTEAGHKIEIDNSPGDRRIHVYHASGTFIEIQDDGARITKIQKYDQEYVDGVKETVVHGRFSLTIDGNYEINVTGKMKIEAGDFELVSHKDINFKSDGNTLQEHGGDQRVQVNGHTSHRTSKNRDLITGGDNTVSTMGNHMSTTVGNYTNSVSGDKYEMVGGLFYLYGGGMDIASGDALGISSVGNLTVNSEAATTVLAGTNITSKVGSTGIKIDSSTVTTTKTTYIGQPSLDGRTGPASPPFHSP